MRKIFLISIVTLFAVTAIAQEQPAAAPSAEQQIQKLLTQKNSKALLGEAIVVGTLFGCTQKTAGKEATQKFYDEIMLMGKTASAYCKEGHATEARALVLSTLDNHRSSPVYQSAINCYDNSAATISGIGGQKMAFDLAKYARWAKDPVLAKRELKETDVCKGKQS